VRSTSRRTPVRPKSEGGPSLPWIPIAIIAGVAVVAGVVVYLIWQSQQSPSGGGYASEQAIEADPAPDLPGEFVDLQKIYEGSYGATEGPNTNPHVTNDVDYTEQGQPPAGGPHWGSTACATTPAESPPFCGPIPFGIFRDEWPAESVVHALEHGGMAVWYNTTNQEVIDDLEDLVRQKGDDDYLIVMVPYSKMDAETVGATAWGRRITMPAGEYDRAAIENFLDKLRCRFNPENFTGRGC
jgi:hypothetical protein